MQLNLTWECNGFGLVQSRAALSTDRHKLVLKYISQLGTQTNRMSKYSIGLRLCLKDSLFLCLVLELVLQVNSCCLVAYRNLEHFFKHALEINLQLV